MEKQRSIFAVQAMVDGDKDSDRKWKALARRWCLSPSKALREFQCRSWTPELVRSAD